MLSFWPRKKSTLATSLLTSEYFFKFQDGWVRQSRSLIKSNHALATNVFGLKFRFGQSSKESWKKKRFQNILSILFNEIYTKYAMYTFVYYNISLHNDDKVVIFIEKYYMIPSSSMMYTQSHIAEYSHMFWEW